MRAESRPHPPPPRSPARPWQTSEAAALSSRGTKSLRVRTAVSRGICAWQAPPGFRRTLNSDFPRHRERVQLLLVLKREGAMGLIHALIMKVVAPVVELVAGSFDLLMVYSAISDRCQIGFSFCLTRFLSKKAKLVPLI